MQIHRCTHTHTYPAHPQTLAHADSFNDMKIDTVLERILDEVGSTIWEGVNMIRILDTSLKFSEWIKQLDKQQKPPHILDL